MALAVSWNLNNSAEKKGGTKSISTTQGTTADKPSQVSDDKEFSEDNIKDILSSLQEDISNKINEISLNIDNTEVLTKLDEISSSAALSAKSVQNELSAIKLKQQSYLYQILVAILASTVALMAVLLLTYRYMKKFIADSMIISSYKNQAGSVRSAETAGENPVLAAVSKLQSSLENKIAESKHLFDPEKAVKLDAPQKSSLADICEEIAFLQKAGCDTDARHQYLTALEKINDKNYSEATKIFEAVTKKDENFSLAFFMLGYIAYVTRKYEAAVEPLEKACRLEPENPAYLISFGNACLKEKKYDQASQALKKAVEIRPDDASAWNNLAHSYIVSDKITEAVEAFAKASELKPDFHEALHNLGLALGKLERYEEALSAFEKAITAKDDKHESMYNAACVYALLGKRDGALSNLKKAIDIQPEYAEKAKKDKDFKSFKDDEEFKKIIS